MRNIFIFLLVPFVLYSISDNVDNTTLHNKALGGPHTGMVSGFDSFFNNPALLAEYDSEFSFFETDINLKGDALDVVNLYLSDELDMADPSGLISTLQDKNLTSLFVGMDLGGPLSLGKIGNNWGWFLNNITSVYLDLPGILSEAEIVSREDLMFSLGIAVPFKINIGDSFFVEITPGVMSRTTIRGEVRIKSDLIGLVGYSDDVSSLLDDYPLTLSPMFGLDAGYNIEFYNIVKLTGVVKDIYTPILKYSIDEASDALDIFTTSEDTTGNLLYREINLGLAVDVPLGSLNAVISDLNLYADYFDLLQFEKNILLHIGLGADIELLDKLHLLAGMNEGLLALGFNVDLGSFNIGLAMYGTEEGTEPGVASTFNFLLSTGISF